MHIQFDSSYARSSKLDFVPEDDNGEREKIHMATRFLSLALMMSDFSLGAEPKAQPVGVPA